jgi:hypothetical protein
VIALTLCTVAACQSAPGPETDAAVASAGTPGAAPRTVWGEPDLSGIWVAANLNAKTHNLAVLEALYRPDAKAAIQRMTDVDDPLLRCIPYGIPRAYLSSPWPFQIVQSPGVTVILTEYYHAFRVIPTDGRPHPTDAYPTYFGDSVARWDGDTLVVDVTAFNGKTWLSDRDKPTATSVGAWPTSDALHVVERWRRVDAETLEYEAVVDDPKMLTGSWTTPTVSLKRAPDGTRIAEAMCFDTTTYSIATAD